MHEFFTYKGRLNRRPYFFRGLAFAAGFLLVDRVPVVHRLALSEPLVWYVVVLALLSLILAFFQCIKRLHDIDRSGWYSLISIVPYLNMAFDLYLTFKRGTNGPNSYGDDPLRVEAATHA